MAIVIKAPDPLPIEDVPTLFLAGTIDNGASDDWQSYVTNEMMDNQIVLLNPRRDEWDSSWEQSIRNPQFRQQVEWELNALERATAILMYIAPNSLSPTSLLEMGLHATSDKMVVVCPGPYWRQGNIEVVSAQYQIPLYDNLKDGLQHIQRIVKI